ncbi:Hypothetical protein A7982_06514 [Minicystis rosea]|nr:Hypothetical protein A7982_06514 [Minicystis rosea]
MLALMGLTTFGFGSAYLVAPQAMAALGGLAITRPAAEAELRGYYGGLQVGMGILFFSGLVRPAMARVGLSAAAILFAANSLGRMLGIVLAGAVDSFNASGVVFEFGFAGMAAYLLRASSTSVAQSPSAPNVEVQR